MKTGDLMDRLAGRTRSLVMGIVNVTPDSFSDGGRYLDPARAVAHARELADAGADLLDIGGESTRPGAESVELAVELERVIPVIEAIASEIDLPISVDTTKPGVMRAAVAAGAGMINDVSGLREEGAVEAVAETGVPACIMHMQGEPRTMQNNPEYRDVVGDIKNFFLERILACEFAGIPRSSLVLDPGFGFGKTLEHNLELLRRLADFADLGCPVLVGISRKSMLGKITGRDRPEDRVSASVAAAVLAAERGAAIIRVHDVAETRDALAVVEALGAG